MDKYKVGFGIAAVMVVGLALYAWANREETVKLKQTLVEKEALISEISSKYKQQLLVNKNIKTNSTIVITKPDGTKITKNTTTEDKSSVNKQTEIVEDQKQFMSKKTRQTSDKTTEVKPSMAKYSLGISYPAKLDNSYTLAHVSVGARFATTPLWLQVEGGVDREFRVGVRVDF